MTKKQVNFLTSLPVVYIVEQTLLVIIYFFGKNTVGSILATTILVTLMLFCVYTQLQYMKGKNENWKTMQNVSKLKNW